MKPEKPKKIFQYWVEIKPCLNLEKALEEILKETINAIAALPIDTTQGFNLGITLEVSEFLSAGFKTDRL